MAEKYHRRVIHMAAEHSPNVRRALDQIKAGLEPDGLVLVPGVLTWDEYQFRMATWDEPRKCVGLGGHFWEGAETLLFPSLWLDRAEKLARERTGVLSRKWMGIDPAEGGDKTAWAIIDRVGLVKLEAMKTPDTNFVTQHTEELITRYNIDPADVGIDLGGGKTHLDRLRLRGVNIRGVRFGDKPKLSIKRGLHQIKDRKEVDEDKYAYANLRTQMYCELSDLLDPVQEYGFTIPQEYHELRRQLAVHPRWQDDHGVYYLPSKTRKPDERLGAANSKQTIHDMLGCSPDEADALVVATHVMLHKPARVLINVV